MTSAAKRVRLSESTKWRNEGNIIYKSTEGLAPLLQSEGLQRAVNLYSRALDLAEDAAERSSACKNIAMASWKLAKAKMVLPNAEDKIVFYNFKQALKHFKEAEKSGRSRELQWRESLTTSALECWSDTKKRLDKHENEERKVWELQPLLGLLFHDATLAKEHFAIAQTYFSWSSAALTKRDFRKALSLLGDCNFPLNEAMRLGKEDQDLMKECRVLEEEIFDRKCVAESIQARTNGDEILKMITFETEDLNINMVWEVIDWYHNAALLIRERDLELEAMALSSLGLVYAKVLKLKYHAKLYIRKAFELINVMVPRNCLNEGWYLSALSMMQQFQQEQVWANDIEKQKQRESVMKEIKDDVDKLNDKFTMSSKEIFLKYVYATYPPKNPKHKLDENAAFEDEEVMKKLYLKAVTHYHPDKVDVEEDGANWKVLCEEIAKLLSHQYQCYKGLLS
ncbi:uncharacterized protein LOC112575014 isoform X1 [Pomacea canaliculata]|uniref:uncharacterized protein LOC112575014 isoform X1 n=1 Tax=Pomacea canaliculata TaxID=400727 RepID=UPI000D73FA0E|nr:uncharacterized protein LOC112575014 isoform X1 [Pomacea canaliculata]